MGNTFSSKFICSTPSRATIPSEEHPSYVNLSLSATKLVDDHNVVHECNQLVVVHMKEQDGNLEELGRTEVVINTSHTTPSRSGEIQVCYKFGAVQKLFFDVYAVDSILDNIIAKDLQLNNQKLLTKRSCLLSQIVTKGSHTLKPRGQASIGDDLTVHMTFSSKLYYLKFVYHTAHRKDLCLEISRKVEAGNSVPPCKAAVMKSNQGPDAWAVILPMEQIGSKDEVFLIQGYECDKKGKATQMFGTWEASISGLEQKAAIKCNQPKDQGIANELGKDLRGQPLFVNEFQGLSFLDYVSDGLEFPLVVAVDLSGTNGKSNDPKSLHYIGGSSLNRFQQVVHGICDVLKIYNSYMNIQAWGFGRKSELSESPFALIRDGPEVYGFEGFDVAYKSALQEGSHYEPDCLSKVIEKASVLSQNPKKYHIMLILTDGDVSDVQDIKDAVVNASGYPLSILIVGVGNGNFDTLKALCGDDGLQSKQGRIASRNPVQFIPMPETNKPMLVDELLRGIPSAFVTWKRGQI